MMKIEDSVGKLLKWFLADEHCFTLYIVVIFVVCHIPRLFLIVAELFMVEQQIRWVLS